MEFYPLTHILFWIAVTLCPQDTSQIIVTGPDKTWTWTMQPSGWRHSVDKSWWAAAGTTVTSRFGEKADEQDVVKFVKGIPEHDWARRASLKLGAKYSLTKQGDTFVYTLDEGESSAKRFVIEFKRAPAQSHLFQGGITFSAPAVQESGKNSDTYWWDVGFGNRPDGPSASAKGKSDLREAVEQAFDARQETQRAEVERIRRELAEIEAAIEAREKHREQIINQRIQELMYPERRSLQDSLRLETGSVEDVGRQVDHFEFADMEVRRMVTDAKLVIAKDLDDQLSEYFTAVMDPTKDKSTVERLRHKVDKTLHLLQAIIEKERAMAER